MIDSQQLPIVSKPSRSSSQISRCRGPVCGGTSGWESLRHTFGSLELFVATSSCSPLRGPIALTALRRRAATRHGAPESGAGRSAGAPDPGNRSVQEA
jgi:hypothetical protein